MQARPLSRPFGLAGPLSSWTTWSSCGTPPSLVNEMLEASPVAILATSRGPLRITFEQQYPVSPVAPDAAITLFERAAQRVRPGFVVDAAVADEVADICSALDGLPLAIELVASRIRHLSVSALAVSIEQVIASSRIATPTGPIDNGRWREPSGGASTSSTTGAGATSVDLARSLVGSPSMPRRPSWKPAR